MIVDLCEVKMPKYWPKSYLLRGLNRKALSIPSDTRIQAKDEFRPFGFLASTGLSFLLITALPTTNQRSGPEKRASRNHRQVVILGGNNRSALKCDIEQGIEEGRSRL